MVVHQWISGFRLCLTGPLWGVWGDWWISLTNSQLCGKYVHAIMQRHLAKATIPAGCNCLTMSPCQKLDKRMSCDEVYINARFLPVTFNVYLVISMCWSVTPKLISSKTASRCYFLTHSNAKRRKTNRNLKGNVISRRLFIPTFISQNIFYQQ